VRKPDPASAPGPFVSPRYLPLLAILSLGFYVAVLSIFRLATGDVFILLKTGEYVLTHGWVPARDTFSFTASDHVAVAHEWLSGVVFYIVHAIGGIDGLILFRAAVAGATVFLLYGTARLLRASVPILLISAALPLYVASARFLDRPHLFSFLFVALYLRLFFQWREGGRRRAWLYAIPPLHILWVNLHGGHLQGLLLVATFAVGEGLAWARARRLKEGIDTMATAGELRLLAALVPSCLLASLVNPYGYRLLTLPFELTGMPIFMKDVLEWRPPYDATYNTYTMFVLFVVHILILCASFFLSQGEKRKWNRLFPALLAGELVLLGFFWFQDPPIHWTPSLLAASLYSILALLALFTLLNWRTVDFTQAGIIALFYLLSLRYNRGTADAALATFPLLAAHASSWLERRRRRPKGGGLAATLASSLLLAAIAAQVLVYGYHYSFGTFKREAGLGIAPDIPVCALDFAARQRLAGNAFVSFGFADPLIYWRSPEVKVNMDTRNEVYGEALFGEYYDALDSPVAMLAYLRRHPIDFFFMDFGDRKAAVFDALDSTGEWAPIYYDDRAFILVRRDPENADLIRREEFRIIHPAVASAPTRVDAASAPLALEEAERSIRNCPGSRFGWFYKARVLLFLGRDEEAIEALHGLLARDPGNAHGHLDLSSALWALGRRDEAIEECERALRIRPGFAEAEARLREMRGR
jgi:tetratricopeptide (TPR) repeat protein